MNTRRTFLIVALLALTATLGAQGPNNTGTYYRAADGKKGSALKTALHNIIKNPSVVSYDGLIDAYRKTDTRPDGYVRDWYSNATNFRHGTDKAGSYSQEGDVYNREHSVPQSWFSQASPMKSDIVHVVPTDGYVNNRRSSYPFGEVGTVTYQSANGYSKLGRSRLSGYSGLVFEPNDEVKGDLARIYFYMVTCYEDRVSNWTSSGYSSYVFDGSSYPALTSWTLEMLLRWSEQDPVDETERARNEAVYEVQKNRNPFVDYPGLEAYIWGSKTNQTFDYTQQGQGETTTVQAPTFSLPSGTYSEAVVVGMSCETAGAAIYYTTDGSVPSASATRYTAPLTLEQTTTLRALAVKDGEQSPVTTAVYIISPNDHPDTGDYVWSEDWSSGSAQASVESIHNDAATYTGDGGQYCKLFDGSLAGGAAPELLIPKTSRNKNSFEATVKLGGTSGLLPLQFKCNRAISVTTPTAGATIVPGTDSGNTRNYIVSVAQGTAQLVLVFASVDDNNARIDDIRLSKPASDDAIATPAATTPTRRTALKNGTYDLSGRRVGNGRQGERSAVGRQKGVYVVGGRKVMIK